MRLRDLALRRGNGVAWDCLISLDMRRVVVATCPLGIVIYRYGRLTPKAWPGVLLGIDSLSTGGKMAPLKVELSMLRGMAGRYGQCADAVADLDTTQATQHLMESLPETDTGRFAVEVGKRVDAAFDATGNRIHNMAGACRSAADNYERTDQALVEKLTEKGVL